jgi:pimeloyl-ACP methyl ester carboxylesterase
MQSVIAGTLGTLIALVSLSYLVEALRRGPPTPASPPWDPDLPVRWATVDGVRLRYVEAGRGPALVLLHTMRTQLDLFQRIIPALAERYHVYAVDLPGHGYSDIPDVDYTADFFIGKIAGFIEGLGLEDPVLVGESIGATAALAVAARRHPRVRAVVAISTYDYDRGQGAKRGSALGRLLFDLGGVPVIGPTVSRLRQYPIVKRVFDGGLHRLAGFGEPLAREMYRVGNRRGHYQAFASLVAQWPTWEAVRTRYGDIDRPVLLLYGDHDWSRPDERAATARLIPGAELRTVSNAGHFLSYDAPEETLHHLVEFMGRLPAERAAPQHAG